MSLPCSRDYEPVEQCAPASTPYPAEGVAIDTLSPSIVQFADSGGQSTQDFYAVSVNDSAFGGVQPGCNGCTIRMTYASPRQ